MENRELQYSEGSSNKFWNIELEGTRFTTHYGRIGTDGQRKEKEFSSEEEAKKAFDKQVQAKLKKGYQEIGGTGSFSQKSTSSKPTPTKQATPAKSSKTSKEKKPAKTKTEKTAKRESSQEESSNAKPVLEKAKTKKVSKAKPSASFSLPKERNLGLEEIDKMRVSGYSKPIKASPSRPFDQEACLKQLSKITGRYEAVWKKLELPDFITPQEAHFWLVGMGKAASDGGKKAASEIKGKSFSGELKAEDVYKMIGSWRNYFLPNAIQIIRHLLSPCELAALGKKKVFGYHNNYFIQMFAYACLFFTHEERQEIEKKYRSSFNIKQWPKDDYQTPGIVFYLASVLGWHDEILSLIESLSDNYYQEREYADHYQVPQEIIFGLGSASLVEKHMRRLKLILTTPEQIRMWIACTKHHALDLVRDSIQKESNREKAEELMQAFVRIQVPEAAPFMLELQLSSKAPRLAKNWLQSNPGYGVLGLLSSAAGKGKLASASIEQLRKYKREGWRAAIKEALEETTPEVRSKILSEVIEYEEKTYPLLTEKKAPQWFKKALKEVPPGKPASWVNVKDLPLLLIDEQQLEENHIEKILVALQKSSWENPLSLLTGLREKGDQGSLDSFAWKLFEAWLEEGAPSKEKWAMGTIGFLGGDASVLKITPLLRQWPGESQHQRAVFGLECLRQTGTDTALMQLNGIAQKLKFKGLKSKAMEFMEQIAKTQGMTRSELEDRIVPDCDLNAQGSRELNFGSRKFFFVLGAEMKPMVRDEAGKIKANLPKPGAKDDAQLANKATEEWKILKKQIRDVAKIQATRLEQAMVTGRRWQQKDFERFLLHHPLMTNFVRLLLWGAYDEKGKLQDTFRITEEREYTNREDDSCSLKKGLSVGVVHPLELSEENKSSWGEIFGDYEIIPPFAQLGRSVYSLEKGEGKQKSIDRFGGISIPAVSLVGAFEKLGWQRGIPEDGGVFFEHSKPFYNANITAVAVYPGVPVGYMVDWDEQNIEKCFFIKGIYTPEMYPDHKNALPLSKVEKIVISEVLNDLSMVASKGK